MNNGVTLDDLIREEIAKHMKCSACGSRNINTKPELYPGGVAAMRSRRGLS